MDVVGDVSDMQKVMNSIPSVQDFKKFDNGKPELLNFAGFMAELGEVSKVIEYGAKKYGRENWKKATVEDLDRYRNAALRHIMQSKSYEIDSESGLPHLAHAITSLLFLMWLEEDLECWT